MGRLLTTKEAADRLRVSPSTLRWWRQISYDGPQGFKVGKKKVVYDEAEIEAYLARQQEAERSA
jgi:predicted DNA-binding transcriptional regulator AlpA